MSDGHDDGTGNGRDIFIPEDVSALSDDVLLQEVENMAAHEEHHTLTSDQEAYLADLREEFLKRVATSGEHADYGAGGGA